MVLNTLSVGAAVTPTVTKTWLKHYTNRKPLRAKPTAHISYDLGLHLVRRFVEYSAFHTVEELQAFTGQWVPAPRWVKVDEIVIADKHVEQAADVITTELGEDGIEQVGGREWWKWRRAPLRAEWIEMRKDYHERRERGNKGNRVMLYVHGGAYYFGSVNEHRYQIQRHARKLKAKCLAPRYRLAPQFPFPCGLQDALAAYLYLLTEHDPTEIIVAGDSAGGGMVLALLVVLRDQGIPLPAGGILLSPWVDLTHSFPSICGEAGMDYIPGDGFMHKPSMGWPPPTADDVVDQGKPKLSEDAKSDVVSEKLPQSPGAGSVISDTVPMSAVDRKRGYSILDPHQRGSVLHNATEKNTANGPIVDGTIDATTHLPAVKVDGKLIQIRDQIQMYAPNHMLFHPLVSPILQPSLGGLPPILIQVGGGELLRDEQIYLAHKLANPLAYQPRKAILDYYDPDRTNLNKYKPTNVQVQLWEDMCHVGHTLSFTRPAKFMYRSVAQFGAWALAHAQGRAIDISMDESSDTDSVSSSEDPSDNKKTKKKNGQNDSAVPEVRLPPSGTVGKAGDPLPQFKDHMIRQRIDRHGNIYDLAPISDLEALNLSPEAIGILKEGPVKKWLVRQVKWNKKFASTKRDLQRKRAQQLAKGYVGLPEGEKPPPSALAGMRTHDLPRIEKVKTSWGLAMWTGWWSKHDQIKVKETAKDENVEKTEAKAEAEKEEGDIVMSREGRAETETMKAPSRPMKSSSSRSTSYSVVDQGQANGNGHLPTLARPASPLSQEITPEGARQIGNTIIPPTDITSTRPTAGGIAYPFKLKGRGCGGCAEWECEHDDVGQCAYDEADESFESWC